MNGAIWLPYAGSMNGWLRLAAARTPLRLHLIKSWHIQLLV
jgi:hypothetical protein